MGIEGNKTLPITVFTGFLGAGKTSLIINLLSRLPSDYKVAILKNEFGDNEVDSQLFQQNSHYQVKEMMNGCLCCVLVGQMKNALLDLKETYNPDRIIVETSGSAFPGPIAWQIRELESDGFMLDSIITVIDCLNFMGYEDTSYTAQLQAKYSDLILLNKVELVDEDRLELVIDRVNDLNTDTPKIKAYKDKGIDPELMLGLDTKLFQTKNQLEVGVIENHHANEVDLIHITVKSTDPQLNLFKDDVDVLFSKMDKESVYRIKGIIQTRIQTSEEKINYLINFAFGRGEWTSLQTINQNQIQDFQLKLTIMGSYLKGYKKKLIESLGLLDHQITYHPVHRHP